MTEQYTAVEEKELVHNLFGSPAKSDASSLDIYDGLDVASLSEELPQSSTPPRDCLDLYEEIITEEVTAKEASYSDLQSEYDKCQKQMKALIGKLREIQTQNTSLQNENLCLKKNISALIKTARVEINRKDEEINNLTQCLSTPRSLRNFKSVPLPPLNSYKTSGQDNMPYRDRRSMNVDGIVRTEVKVQSTSSEGTVSGYSDKKASEKENISGPVETGALSSRKGQNVMQSLGTHLQKEVTEGNLDAGEKEPRKEKDTDNRHRDSDHRWRKEERQHSASLESEKKNFDLREKLIQSSSNQRKNEVGQESKSTKSDINHEMGNKKYLSSRSYDKSDSTRDKTQLRDPPRPKDMPKNKREKSPRNRDSKGYERCRETEHRKFTTEKKDNQPRRSKRTISCPKDESSHKSVNLNDSRNRNDLGRKEKHASDYGKDLRSTYNKESESKNEISTSKNVTQTRDDKSTKYDRDRRHDEKKRSRDDRDTSRHERKGHTEKEKLISRSPSKKRNKVDSCSSEQESLKNEKTNAEKTPPCNQETNTQKNMKLSFMETLNLTLSPVKKKSHCEVEHGNKNLSSVECTISAAEEIAMSSDASNCLDITVEKKTETNLNSTKEIDSNDIPEEKGEMQTGGVEEMLSVCESESTVGPPACLQELPPALTVVDANATPVKMQHPPEAPTLEIGLADDFISLSSDEMETRSCVDIAELESFIEIDKCSGSESPNESHTDSVDDIVQSNACQDEAMLSEQIHDATACTTNNLEPKINENPKGICDSSNNDFIDFSTKRVDYKHDDESSVISVDLSLLRDIPKMISPLKSPQRHIGTAYKVQCTAKAPVVGVFTKDADTNNPCISLSNELNKENCQPVNKTDTDSENNCPIIISSDEVEDGEIISDDDNAFKSEKTLESSNQSNSVEKGNIVQSPVTCKREMTSLTNANGLISKTPPASKEKAEIRRKTKLIPLPDSTSRKQNNSCLTGIVEIVEPSTVQDVLQMSKIIWKHIRRKYMKFNAQFSAGQFDRIIEHGTLYLIELMKSLNWSTLCSSPDSLKKCVCNYIESKLKQVKNNGIVDRIFEQRLMDMKQKLWKFVDEQLESLFDTLNTMLTRLCDKVKEQCVSGTSLLTSETTANPKGLSGLVNDSHKSSKKRKKKCASKKNIGVGACLRQKQLELQHGSKGSPTKHLNSSKKLTVPKEGGSNPVNDTRPCVALCKNVTANPAEQSHLTNKSVSPKHNKSIENTSELSFNLVSDDHMGDLFKRLLHDSEQVQLEPNNILDEDIFAYKSPEKNTSSLDKSENGNLSTGLTPTKSFCSWVDSFIHPDILDESCMLEIPNNVSSDKNITRSEERTKSFTSVLLEDLAVSLTVPSPLKSDSHLSFLREVSAPDAVLEEVINAHYSEDALLEEDATEQDIHLTLDSENSSSSLPDTNETPTTFQYDPSEPMQAVIMEKSNDHFIVKIRRAVSANSPNSECSSTEDAGFADIQLPQPEGKTLENMTCNHNDNVPSKDGKGSDVLREDAVCQNKVFMHDSGGPETSEGNLDQPYCRNEAMTFKPPEELIPGLKLLESFKDAFDTTTDVNMSLDAVKDSTESEKGVNMCSSTTDEDLLTGEDESTGSSVVKKRKIAEKGESLPKRQKISPCQASEVECIQNEQNNKAEANTSENCTEKCNRSDSDELAYTSSPSNLSAKNIIKKKGEVIVSWTREEDRAILVECQKLGPNEKTFQFLSLKMNKLPFQIEERFRQLVKLFKKSKRAKN